MAGYFVGLDCIIKKYTKTPWEKHLNTTVYSHRAMLKCLFCGVFYFSTSEGQRGPIDVLFFQSPLLHS